MPSWSIVQLARWVLSFCVCLDEWIRWPFQSGWCIQNKILVLVNSLLCPSSKGGQLTIGLQLLENSCLDKRFQKSHSCNSWKLWSSFLTTSWISFYKNLHLFISLGAVVDLVVCCFPRSSGDVLHHLAELLASSLLWTCVVFPPCNFPLEKLCFGSWPQWFFYFSLQVVSVLKAESLVPKPSAGKSEEAESNSVESLGFCNVWVLVVEILVSVASIVDLDSKSLVDSSQ